MLPSGYRRMQTGNENFSDEYSDLSGEELVDKKVKLLV